MELQESSEKPPRRNTINSSSRRQFLARAGAAGLGLALPGSLAACGPGETQAERSRQRNVTFILDVSPYGAHTPFYVAKHKGFWAERGLNVTMRPGQGSADTVTKVGAGAGEFGFADTSATILGRANKGVNAKLVCMYHYKNLMSAQALASADIRKPKDLVDKNMVTTPGDADLVLLPALATINGFDAEKVGITRLDYASLTPAVTQGNADGKLDYFTGYPTLVLAAREKGEETTYFLYADYGLDVYNNGIIVLDKMLDSDPDTVRSFNAGLVDAVVYTVAHQNEAVQIFRDHVPGFSETLAQAQQQVTINHFNVEEVRAHGFGPMSAKKMSYTLRIDGKYFDLERKIASIDDIYTNDYTPVSKVPNFSNEPGEGELPIT